MEPTMTPTGWLDPPDELGTHRIVLERGQSLPDPTSTSRRLYGPMVLDWSVYPSHIAVYILDGDR